MQIKIQCDDELMMYKLILLEVLCFKFVFSSLCCGLNGQNSLNVPHPTPHALGFGSPSSTHNSSVGANDTVLLLSVRQFFNLVTLWNQGPMGRDKTWGRPWGRPWDRP